MSLVKVAPFEAALSLQSAAKQFLQSHGGHQLAMRDHVVLTSSCEINEPCRSVLSKTYGPVTGGKHCVFPDILKIDRNKGSTFCLAHQKMCPLKRHGQKRPSAEQR